MNASALPLDGILVVSIEQAVAAPFATRQLADLGARVVKVERPRVGDFARHYDGAVHGESSYFVWLNRSKESLTLDIKTDDGRAILEDLLGRADVFVQNLVPGAAERLGFGAAALAERFPRVIPCSISGYGDEGAWARRKAYDMLIQCEVGLVALTGTPEWPSRVGISIADIAAGMYAYTGILTALYRRATTGEVSAVDVSMLEALGEWMGAPAYYARYGGREPERVGAAHATIAPYGAFATADGTAIVLAVQNEREWARFCDTVLGDPSLATDPRFLSPSARVAHRDELDELVAKRLNELPPNEAGDLLDQAEIANARLNSVSEFLAHPALAQRHRWRTVTAPGGPIEALLPPANLADTEPRMGPVPLLGADTESILAELGRDAATIEELRARGAV